VARRLSSSNGSFEELSLSGALNRWRSIGAKKTEKTVQKMKNREFKKPYIKEFWD